MARELENLPSRQMMLLAHGEKAMGYDAATLGNWFRDRCNEAELPHCAAHGLRKAGVRRLAEHGATEWEVMAFLAHTTAKEASRYVAEADRIKLTTSRMAELTSMEGIRCRPTFRRSWTKLARKLIPRRWQPVGESNPSFQVENLAS
jgi:hypothetical protein